jgi:trehalose 6-phosphate phosphatase
VRSRANRTSKSVENRLPSPRAEWAYFFDIDGTLVDISPTPWEVKLETDLVDLIRQLYEATGGAIALISGRSIEDIDSIFHGEKLPVAGQHGVERRDAKGRITRHRVEAASLTSSRARLREAAARHEALVLEDKGLSLALHYRRSPALGSYVHRLMRILQQEIGSDYTVLTGKRIVELKPSGKDKGQAVQEFMEEQPFKGRLPVFVGDDVTDEYGFAVVNSLGGYSIKVGPGPSSAQSRLRDVRSVRKWLERAVRTAATPASQTG